MHMQLHLTCEHPLTPTHKESGLAHAESNLTGTRTDIRSLAIQMEMYFWDQVYQARM